jgi:PadR family transcriptional regulator, regulatory protein PadR
MRCPKEASEILQGTLDLMILKTLDAMGSAAWLRHRAPDRATERGCTPVKRRNRLYLFIAPAAVGLISSSWGASENNRKAKFYSITKAGRRRLAEETANWERIAGVIGRVLQASGG